MHIYSDYVCTEIYYKNLAHAVMEAGKFKNLQCGLVHPRPRRASDADEVQTQSAGGFPFPWEVSVLFCSGLQLIG